MGLKHKKLGELGLREMSGGTDDYRTMSPSTHVVSSSVEDADGKRAKESPLRRNYVQQPKHATSLISRQSVHVSLVFLFNV